MTISEERKKRVIDLYYNQKKTTRELAKIERMSIRDIYAIIRKKKPDDYQTSISSIKKIYLLKPMNSSLKERHRCK